MNIFTEAGDLVHADVIVPIENFWQNDVEPFYETDVKPVLLTVENTVETYGEQFADGIGADALAAGVELVNGAQNLTSLGGVVTLAESIGTALVNQVEESAKTTTQEAVTASQNIILNAARTVLTAAVTAQATVAAAAPAAPDATSSTVKGTV